MGGGPLRKDFLDPLRPICRNFCRRTATVDRKDRNIKDLNEAAIVTRDDVVAAAERIAGLVERTPLIESEFGGARIWLKCECLQTGGAFKLRGATNRLLQLSRGGAGARRRRLLLGQSRARSGHRRPAARHPGRSSSCRPTRRQVKVEGTRAEGAEIVFYDRRTESREAIAARLPEETGATVVPSFDDPAIVAGQGTAGLEILEQLAEPPRAHRRSVRRRRACVGDRACLSRTPRSSIVEPEGWDDMARVARAWRDRSRSRRRADDALRRAPDSAGVADHLRHPRERGASALSVSDEEVAEAMRFAWERHELVVEPGGAAALAALLAGKLAPREDTVVVLSGGNVDPALHARIVARRPKRRCGS